MKLLGFWKVKLVVAICVTAVILFLGNQRYFQLWWPRPAQTFPIASDAPVGLGQSCECKLRRNCMAYEAVCGTDQVRDLKCEWNGIFKSEARCSYSYRFVPCDESQQVKLDVDSHDWSKNVETFKHMGSNEWCAKDSSR